MKHTLYYQSGRHKENILAAKELATKKHHALKAARVEDYNCHPQRCLNCDSAISYDKRHNKFCTKSCAATYNNKFRPAGSESRITQGEKLVGRSPTKSKKGLQTRKWSKISWYTCKNCQKIFYTRSWSSPRITCGKYECKTNMSVGTRSYTNGRRKLFNVYNKWDDKIVLLESSWELSLAEWLDSNNIPWSRPSYIKWKDENIGKTRLYYPDFYLKEINLYLDPKNPTAMKKDQYKMSQVEKLIPIIYGNLEKSKQRLL
jgi:hypothetical protein